MTRQVSQASRHVPENPASTLDTALPIFSQELFWRCRFLTGNADLAHLPFLFWLVSDLRPRRCVTLNPGDGLLHFAICQAIDKSGLEARCQGFGLWDDAEVPADLARYNARQYAEISTLQARDPTASAHRVRKGSVDLLVLAGPLDKALLDALENIWFSRMRKRGIILLTGTAALDDPAQEALDRVIAPHQVMHFEHGSGLMAIVTGDMPTERVARMLNLEADGLGLLGIERIFARLGTLHVNEWTAQAAEARFDSLRAGTSGDPGSGVAVDTAARDTAPAAGQDMSREAALAELEDLRIRDLNHLTQCLSEAEERAISQAEEIKLLRTGNRETQTRLEQARAELDSARGRIAELEQGSAELDSALRRSQADITAYSDATALSEQTASGLRDMLAARDAELHAMAAALDRLQAENRDLHDHLATQEKTAARDSASLDTVRAECSALKGEASAARRKLRLAERQLAKTEKTLAALRKSHAELAEDREALLKARERLMASTSWRVTSPLRRASALLGRAQDGDQTRSG